MYSTGDSVYPVCSNDDIKMTFDLFTVCSNFWPSFFGNTERSSMAFADKYAIAVFIR